MACNLTFSFFHHTGQFGADPLQQVAINFLLLEIELEVSKARSLVVLPCRKGFNNALLQGLCSESTWPQSSSFTARLCNLTSCRS